MPRKDSSPFSQTFPVKGVDRSMPVHAQPDLTCPDARNVRAFPALTDNAGGGRRSGTVKEFSAQVGESGARQINALANVPRTVIENVPVAGDYESVRELWTQFVASSPVLGGAYTCYTKRRNAAWTWGLDDASKVLVVTGGSFTGINSLQFTGMASTTAGGIILAVNYPTKNRARVRLGGKDTSTATDTATGTTTTQEMTYCGPIVRASKGYSSFFVAYLQSVGPNSVQLVIDKHDGGTVTRVATSQRTLALKGSDTGATVSVQTMTIELNATPSTLRASVSCPSFLTPASDSIVVENNTDLASQTRAGIWYGMGDGVSCTALRYVLEFQYERLVPRQSTVVKEMNGGTWPPEAGPNQYYLDTGWTSETTINDPPTATAVLASGAGYNSNTAPAANQPVIDRTGVGTLNTIRGGQNRANRTFLLYPTTAPTTRNALEVRFRDISTGEDYVGFCTRIHNGATRTDGNMLKVQIKRRISSAAVSMKQSNLTEVQVVQVADSVISTLATTTYATGSGSEEAPVFSTQQPIRFVDSGTRLSIYINGIEVWGYDTTTYASSSVRIGADFNGSAATCQAGGVRFVEAASASVTTVSAGTDIVAFTNGYIDVGDRASPSFWSRCSGGGFSTATIERAVLDNKVYAVDGSSSLIIDPINKTATAWKAEYGTFPARCELVATYRGRLFLARSPENKSLWYCSRMKAPNDWDFGSTSVLSTKAYSGNITASDVVGAPPDPITALIPYADDYLIIGCEGSIHVIEGDPGAGGSVQLVSNKTGILGPRAWCFDEQGSMYFLGSGGLYVMARASRDFQPIGHRRLVQYLDRVDLSTTLVQMVYEPFKSCVHIFLTPRDGLSAGVHVVYQPPMDAFWLDEYPVGHGPFAVCDLGGDTDEDRRFLMGGKDGYVRRPSDLASNDDGREITSYVRFPVFDMADGTIEPMATSIQGVLARGSGPVNWYYLVGDSPEDVNAAATSAARVSGTFTAGDYTPQGLRESGPAHQVVIEGNGSSAWALQRIVLMTRAERQTWR